MDESNTTLEIHGRLWLWITALLECEQILKLALRAEMEMNTQESIDKEMRYEAAFNLFTSTQPDYSPGTSKQSHRDAFSKIQQKEFPAYTECFSLRNYLLMLATVLFCQIFNNGFGSEGKAAGNTKTFISLHLSNVLDKVFTSDEEKIRFESFSNQLKSARDKMIGHADSDAFDIKYVPGSSSMKLPSAAILGIDVEYWSAIISPLRLAVIEYSNQVTFNCLLR